MRRASISAIAAIALVGSVLTAQRATAPLPASAGKTLDIYVIDTEGGKAALYVLPSGETVLVDTGSPGGRDVGRLMEVITAVGVKKIDHLISTHYHVDHIGGLQELVAKMPIAHFIDHGPTVETAREQVANFQQSYASLYAKATRTIAKPGDRLPLTGVDWRIVASAGQPLKTTLPGGGLANGACANFERKPDAANPDDNGQSVGSVITFGQFRMIDLADLLWNNEFDLMCPRNPIGTVDLYMVSHHGLDQSGSTALVHGLRPRVAVMQNGTRKGGTPQTFTTLQTSPGFEDLWQLHWSYNGLIENNPAGHFIANVDDLPTIAGILTAAPPGDGAGRGRQGAGADAPGQPGAQGATATVGQPQTAAAPAAGGRGQGGGGQAQAAHTPAHWIKISAQSTGTFTISNSRNGFSKTYVKR